MGQYVYAASDLPPTCRYVQKSPSAPKVKVCTGPVVRHMSMSDVEAEAVPPPAESDSVVLLRLDQRTQQILDQQTDEARSRRIAMYFGIAGALFAAVKLGVIAMPHFRSVHRTSSHGVLTPIAANPARRRRRRQRRRR